MMLNAVEEYIRPIIINAYENDCGGTVAYELLLIECKTKKRRHAIDKVMSYCG